MERRLMNERGVPTHSTFKLNRVGMGYHVLGSQSLNGNVDTVNLCANHESQGLRCSVAGGQVTKKT